MPFPFSARTTTSFAPGNRWNDFSWLSFACLIIFFGVGIRAAEPAKLRVATFDVDATPPVGSPMFYDPVRMEGDIPLRCRGIVLLGAGRPIVLCAVDWIAINNEAHDAFRDGLAEAADTDRAHVAVHCLHQHDAPGADFTAEKILKEKGFDPGIYRGDLTRQVISRAADAIRRGLPDSQPVTHAGYGEADVEGLASNRRIPGPDGKVRAVRYTACPDPALRAEPVGVIDPAVSVVSLWNEGTPVAVLSYYATHPQSYYRTGIPSPDIPGIARLMRNQAVPEALHVHFNGAGGNIGAGKYNDGSTTNRPILAMRLFDGMSRAWTNTRRSPISPTDVHWRVESIRLPIASHLDPKSLEAGLGQPTRATSLGVTDRLAWIRRNQSGHALDISSLRLGRIRTLHMPGELFVEYQLAAKRMRSHTPGDKVVLAAYGDTGMWYIGTRRAYSEGGYETEPRSSYVSPDVEDMLLGAMKRLLAD